MKLNTATSMLYMLEDSGPDHDQDDAYYIIQRILRTEIRKRQAMTPERVSDHGGFFTVDNPTEGEMATWNAGDRVNAIKNYRVRTGSGLLIAKRTLEEYAAQNGGTIYPTSSESIEVTSCG